MGAYAHFSSTLFALLDYQSMSYPFMSRNVKNVMGHPIEAFNEGGLEFTLYHNLNFALLNDVIFHDRADFMALHKEDPVSNFRFSMGYDFLDCFGKTRQILQRHIITELNSNALPKGIMAFCWDISGHSKESRIFHEIESFDPDTSEWNTVLLKEFFPKVDQDKLISKRELEILKWMVDGLSSKQIAEKLYISKLTVDTHRKNMLRRTNSKNMAELIMYATNFDLL